VKGKKRCETCRFWERTIGSNWRDPRVPEYFWAAGHAVFVINQEIGRCNAEEVCHPDYSGLYTAPDQGEHCPFWEKFDLDWELSKEEALKAGPLAEKVEKACKDLTRVYGRWKNPPPLFYHHIDCTPDGWYIDGSFVWDGIRYRFEDFQEDPRKGLYESIIQRTCQEEGGAG